MEKLLILGSDLGTIDIARTAKQMGYYVITADFSKTSPTKEVSDEAWEISTVDTDKLQEKCISEGVSAVLYGVSEFNLVCARNLCKRLGLPMLCKNDEAWEISRYKNKFKDLCIKNSIPVPDNYILSEKPTEEELSKIKYPVVVKPVDMSANRGMSYCNNNDELLVAVNKARETSPTNQIICERQLHGPEWVANYVFAEGVARLLYFGREYNAKNAPENFYSIIITSAAHLKQYNDEINEKVISFFKKANYTDGIGWVELMLDDDGHFYLIEPAYRMSSEAIYSMYSRICGFDATKWVIETAFGKKHSVSDLPEGVNKAYDSCVASYHLFASTAGTIENIKGIEELDSLANISVDIPNRVGKNVNYGAIIGLVKIYGEDINEVIDGINKVNETLFIENANGENMFYKFDNTENVRNDYYLGLEQYKGV